MKKNNKHAIDIDKEMECLLEKYSNNQDKENVILKSPFSYLLCQKLYIKIDTTGDLEQLEKKFLIDYMRSGLMSKEEMQDYEYLRERTPKINLPEIDF